MQTKHRRIMREQLDKTFESLNSIRGLHRPVKGWLRSIREALGMSGRQLADRIGLTEAYEVAGNFSGAGVNGTDIPNYIYRWTEREVEKTIKTYAPHMDHTFEYRYSSHYPDGHGFNAFMKVIVKLLKPAYLMLKVLFPKQQNHFAFFVHKPIVPGDLKPWLSYDEDIGDIKINRDWIKNSYTKRLSR